MIDVLLCGAVLLLCVAFCVQGATIRRLIRSVSAREGALASRLLALEMVTIWRRHAPRAPGSLLEREIDAILRDMDNGGDKEEVEG